MSAFARPILVPLQGEAQLLDRIPLTKPESKALYTENWLQGVLYDHPQCLPVQELDSSIAELVPLCREMPTNAGPVDVVFVTRDGRPVLVEAKLWRNPEARRRVIGQILDYAKELARWSAVDFEAAVRKARLRDGMASTKGLYALLGLPKDSLEAAQFHDALSRNLMRGELLLLIVGDGIREGVGAITDFMEEHGTLHFTFGLIEVAMYATPDGGLLVQPRVLLQSDIVRRIVVDVRKGAHSDDVELESEKPGVPSPHEKAESYNQFWQAFLDRLQLDRPDQPIGSASRGADLYFWTPAGDNGSLSAFLDLQTNSAGVRLYFRKGVIGDRMYLALDQDRKAIEHELGVPVMWFNDTTRHWIVTNEQFPGPLLGESADAVREKLSDWTNRYVNTFRPRLEALARELG